MTPPSVFRKMWWFLYQVEDNWRCPWWGGWVLSICTPLFFVEIAHCFPEPWNWMVSDRVRFAVLPRRWSFGIKPWEGLYRHYWSWYWDTGIDFDWWGSCL